MNLIYVAGEEFEFSAQASLYELIRQYPLDGLIIWNSFVSPRSSLKRFQEFVDQFAPLPVVCIEAELQGASNLTIDNAQGVRDLLDHLVLDHHYQRIAFIGQSGNATAQIRQDACAEYLTEAGLYQPQLFGELDELDRRGLLPGLDYRAILVQSDAEAAHLVDILNERGIQVPQDVAVVGFNDGQEARGCLPALTTIRIPFRIMGWRAVEMLVRRINGRGAAENSTIPLQLITRRSCGCLEPMAERALVGKIPYQHANLAQVLPKQRSLFLDQMSRGMGAMIDTQAYAWAGALFDIFTRELLFLRAGKSDGMPSPAYLYDLSVILRQATSEGANVSRWHEAVSALRRRMLPLLDAPAREFAEDLWQQMRVLVGQTAVRSEVHHGWQTAQRGVILRGIEASLLFAQDFEQLKRTLAQGLGQLKLNGIYLVLYDYSTLAQAPSAKLIQAMWVYLDGQLTEVPLPDQPLAATLLLPEECLEPEKPYSMVVEALQQGNEQLGLLVFKSKPPTEAFLCDVYETLRIQISGALKNIRLRQELQEALRREAEANQLKSQFLSMVSHELRTPLNLIVGLSEMALRQEGKRQKERKGPGNRSRPPGEITENEKRYHDFLEQIYTSGQHLDRLIRDVLDLASSQAGQMSLVCEPLDLILVLDDVVCMGGQLAQQKNLAFTADIPPNLAYVWGDKTRLRQVFLNLVSNAVKFTAHGGITLRAETLDSEIRISIHDTGLGIAPEEIDLIFNEFYQSNRSTTRGYGGIGLGLAISRKLIAMHQGKIWVTSPGNLQGGSTFWVSLPIMSTEHLAEETKAAFEADLVLILSGSLSSSQPLSSHLTGQGFHVETLELGENEIGEGQPRYLSRILTSPPGAVVLDIAPASELGWQIMKTLKENPLTQDLPVLFFSLFLNQDRGNVLELDYMTKPMSSDDLVKALNRFGLREQKNKRTPKLLLIDDEAGILDLHESIVRNAIPECQVFQARNGAQGLEVMRQVLPDLVLLDLLMPELDGFGVLKKMQEAPALRGIPVIVLSGQVLTEKELSRLNQGVAAVLEKGLFSKDEIAKRIELTLSRSKRLGNEGQRLVHRAMAFIHEHYAENISRGAISSHLSINEQYLSRCFKNEIGVGPMVYLSRYRIEQARRLLENSDASITQVALAVGLSSQSYFSRIFQQETGITPSAYRRGERDITQSHKTTQISIRSI